MGLFDLFKKKEKTEVKTNIHAVSHVKCGPWHQYDVLLSTTIFGWEYILKWADYMVASDMKQVDQVSVSEPGTGDINITGEFEFEQSIKNMPTVMTEYSSLGLAGISNMSRGPIKIVWYNQTKMLRFFITTRNDEFILKYVDTMVERTFGTRDQMKLYAKDIKVEDLILAATGELVKQNSKTNDEYLKQIAAKLSDEDKAKIISYMEEGKPLLAIKLCKDSTGEGLKYVKDLIDNYTKYIAL